MRTGAWGLIDLGNKEKGVSPGCPVWGLGVSGFDPDMGTLENEQVWEKLWSSA